MCAHINYQIQRIGDVFMQLENEKRDAELKFWKRRAEALSGELENIPKALHQYGTWEIRDDTGQTTYVILDQDRHPKQKPPAEKK